MHHWGKRCRVQLLQRAKPSYTRADGLNTSWALAEHASKVGANCMHCTRCVQYFWVSISRLALFCYTHFVKVRTVMAFLLQLWNKQDRSSCSDCSLLCKRVAWPEFSAFATFVWWQMWPSHLQWLNEKNRFKFLLNDPTFDNDESRPEW